MKDKKENNYVSTFLIVFLAFALLAIVMTAISLSMYKNIYILKNGEPALARVTERKYSHGSSSTSYYKYAYEFEIDGTIYNGMTSGQYSGNYLIDPNTTYYINIVYLPNGDSCAADYAKANDLVSAVISYVSAALAIVFFTTFCVSLFRRNIRQQIILHGYNGTAKVLYIEGVNYQKTERHRIIYEFEIPHEKIKKVKTPFIYSYKDAAFLYAKGIIDIKHDNKGRSAIDLSQIPHKNHNAGQHFDLQKKTKQVEYVEMPKVFQCEPGNSLLTELYTKKTHSAMSEFLKEISNRNLPQELIDALHEEAKFWLQ